MQYEFVRAALPVQRSDSMTSQNNGSNENKNPAAAARGSQLASDFTVSVHYDSRLYREDIAGSIAHARMLGRQGIIESDDVEKIVEGLAAIVEEIESGKFEWKEELEDIHMNVESRLRTNWRYGRTSAHSTLT